MLEQWIDQFGPWAVFVGLLLEGEMALIVAGYALSRGYLDLLPTLLLGTAGGTFSDSIYYWIGRRVGQRLLRGRRSLRPLRARAVLLLRRYGEVMAFATRFAFGMRIVLPVAMGSNRMRPGVFHPYNAMGAFVFAIVYLSLGYGFGAAIQRLIRRSAVSELQVVGALGALAALLWVTHRWRSGRRRPALRPPR